MAQRTITDVEIALIKAMLNRGMENKNIQFFFNRPDRAVNSGRISGIRDGKYGNSKSIKPASDSELDAFISSHPAPSPVGAVPVPISGGRQDDDPISADRIRMYFALGVDGLWRLAGGETDRHECKSNFGFKHQDKWLRPIAALANNAGGYLFFGVNDKDVKGPSGEDHGHAVSGMDTDEFEKADPADFARRIRAVFAPTPQFQVATATIGGKKVGVIYVQRHESRPVIATKQEGSIKEGDIFFRYPGQSTRINYSDLRAMLDARESEARKQMLPMIGRLLRLGPARAMIADLQDGTLGDAKTAIQIDEALVEKLKFIKEGEFEEVEGAPALRLIGDVEAVGTPPAVTTEYDLLTRKQLIAAFLNQTVPHDPKLYIRFAVEGGQGAWLPLHFFANKAGLTRAELTRFIGATDGTPAMKATYARRVQPDAAFYKLTAKSRAVLSKIVAGELSSVSSAAEAGQVGLALQGLARGAKFDLSAILSLLRDCLELAAGTSTISFIRRGLCRVDELAFDEPPESATITT